MISRSQFALLKLSILTIVVFGLFSMLLWPKPDVTAFANTLQVDTKKADVTDDNLTLTHGDCGCVKSKEAKLSNLTSAPMALAVQHIGPDGAVKSGWEINLSPYEVVVINLPKKEDGSLKLSKKETKQETSK
jgi:hypothetical protein